MTISAMTAKKPIIAHLIFGSLVNSIPFIIWSMEPANAVLNITILNVFVILS